MEAHPVPKNVLNVEFKLFGSLSVKQFSKVLLGSAIALGLYGLTSTFALPIILTGPIMVVSVLTGVGAALIPAFETKLSALMKVLFVAPRYVWKKDQHIPDILTTRGKATARAAVGISGSSLNPVEVAAPTIDDMSIDQILAARSIYSKEAGLEDDGREAKNFGRVYDEQFALANTKSPSPEARSRELSAKPAVSEGGNLAGKSGVQDVSTLNIGQGKVVEVNPLKNNTPREKISPQVIAETSKSGSSDSALTPEEVAAAKVELDRLRKELVGLNKERGNAENKQQIIDKINLLYSALGISTPAKAIQLPTTSIGVETSELMPLFGVIVDKQDKPLNRAHIRLMDLNRQHLGPEAFSADDGRFSLPVPEHSKEVVVEIEKEGHRFHPFKVKISEGKLPAFKFREH